MRAINCTVICKCCNKEYIVTDIDFVNQDIIYIEDDLRCRLNRMKFEDAIEIRMKEPKHD